MLLSVSLVNWLGISTWNPPQSLAWQKGFRLASGLIWSLLGLLLLVRNLLSLASVPVVLPVVIVGISWWDVLLWLLLSPPVLSRRTGGSYLILLLGHTLSVPGGHVSLLSLCGVHPFGLLLGCLPWTKTERF